MSDVVILNGWKEIANHLGRGVRTVQRWEQLGLPVRRPKGTDRSAVLALSEELDDWVRSCAAHSHNGKLDCHAEIAGLSARLKRINELVISVREQRAQLSRRTTELRSRIDHLRRRYSRKGARVSLVSVAAAEQIPAPADDVPVNGQLAEN